MKYRVIWAVYLAIGIAFELWAVFNSERSDTLSEQVWWFLLLSPLFWFLGAGFLAWLGLHFLRRTYRKP